jgi:hypothetical protein
MDILFVIETVQLHEFQKLEQAQRRSVMPKGMMKVDTTHAHILRTRLLWIPPELVERNRRRAAQGKSIRHVLSAPMKSTLRCSGQRLRKGLRSEV